MDKKLAAKEKVTAEDKSNVAAVDGYSPNCVRWLGYGKHWYSEEHHWPCPKQRKQKLTWPGEQQFSIGVQEEESRIATRKRNDVGPMW